MIRLRLLKKLLAIVSAITLGALALTVGTVIHQVLLRGFPIGIAAAGLMLLSAGQNLRESKLLSWIFTIFFSLGMLLIAGSGNQDALLPANNLGYIWSYGSIGLSFLISFWPRIKIRP